MPKLYFHLSNPSYTAEPPGTGPAGQLKPGSVFQAFRKTAKINPGLTNAPFSIAFRSLVLLTGLLAFSFSARAQSQLNYTNTYYGNSWRGGDGTIANGERHVQNFVESMFVTPDGITYTNAGWDEAAQEAGIYGKNGEWLSRLEGAHANSDGGAVTATATHVWLSWQEGSVQRYHRSTRTGDGAAFKVSTAEVKGLAVRGTELFVSDQAGGKIKVYDAATHAFLREWAVAGPGALAVDADGFLWVVQKSTNKVLRYSADGTRQSQEIALAKPVALCVDKNNRLLVADDGPDQNVKIYTSLGTTPALSSTFGQVGGVYAGPVPGLVGPARFHDLTGVGTDADGNVYVTHGGSPGGVRSDGNEGIPGGTELESYAAAGTRNWARYGLQFLDNGGVDPATDGVDIYTKHEHIVMDYSKPTDEQWSYKGYTLNPLKYPNDPRILTSLTSAFARRVNGNLVMYLTGMYGEPFSVYSFNQATDGEIAIPAYTHTKIGDYCMWPDKNGHLWEGTPAGLIYKTPLTGFDGTGKPAFGTAQLVGDVSALFTELMRLEYHPDTDVMFLAGYTAQNPHTNSEWGIVGREIMRFDNWSTGNRTPRYRIELPYLWVQSSPFATGDKFVKAMATSDDGNYVFAADAREGFIKVYDGGNGSYLGDMVFDDSYGAHRAQIDVPYGISVFKRSNGTYMVVAEEDLFAKTMIYHFTPPAQNQVFISGPADNSTVVSGRNMPISAYVADADGSIDSVAFYHGTTYLGSDLTIPYAFTWTNPPIGTYAITAKAYDQGAVVGTSAPVTVSVVSLPDLVVTDVSWEPANPAAGTLVTFKATIQNQGVGATPEGKIIGGAFRVNGELTNWSDYYSTSLLPGGSVVITANQGPAGATTWAAIAGLHTVSFQVDDINRMEESNEENNTYAEDLCVANAGGAPIVVITSPVVNQFVNIDSTVTVTTRASDCDGTVSKVEFFVGGAKIGEATAAPFRTTWTPLRAGTYVFTAVATDNEGKTGTSAAVEVVVYEDITLGGIITARGDNGGESKENAFDNDLGSKWLDRVPQTWIQYEFADGSRYQVTRYALTSANDVPNRDPKDWVLYGSNDGTTWTRLDERTNEEFTQRFQTRIFSFTNATAYKIYRFEFINRGDDIFQLAEIEFVKEPSASDGAPTVVLTSPAPNAAFTPGASVALAASARDRDGTVTKVEFLVNGVKIGESLTSPYGVTWSNVAEGSYALKAVATDNEGKKDTSVTVPVNVFADITVGGIITARGEKVNEETKEQAFDNDVTTKWLDLSARTWIQYQFAAGQTYVVDQYTLTSANDAPDRDPKDWTFLGSVDGINYDVLDTRTNQDFPNRFQTRSFSCANTKAYAYYRFEFVNNYGDIFQLAEIELIRARVATAVTGFTLINADTDQDVKPLRHGDVVSLREVSNARLSVRAATTATDRVVFRLDQTAPYTDSAAPFALAGDNGAGDYNGVRILEGQHTLTATPYRLEGGSYVAGTTVTIQFSVVKALKSAREGVPAAAAMLSAYPNPVRDKCTLSFGEAPAGKVALQLVDGLGKPVYQARLNPDGQRQVEVDLQSAGLRPGLYLVRATDEAGKVYLLRLLKQ